MKSEGWGGLGIVAACLLLAACATDGVAPRIDPENLPVGAVPPAASSKMTLADERALYGAESAYSVAANLYLETEGAGLLSTATKAQAKSGLASAYAALLLARKAYAVGDAASLGKQIAASVSLANSARDLVKGNP